MFRVRTRRALGQAPTQDDYMSDILAVLESIEKLLTEIRDSK